MALPFPDFARLISRLLSELGYEDVRLMGITNGTGRNSYGGYDLQATVCNGLSSSLLLAQIKQYQRPIPRSFVDELRGTMSRLGAHHGLLITTSSFSVTAQAASAAKYALPVTLIEGDKLMDLLMQHSVTIGKPGQVGVLRKYPSGKLEQSKLLETPELPPPQAEVQITLTVGIPDTQHEHKRQLK